MALDAAVELFRILATHFNSAASWYSADTRLLEDLVDIYQTGFSQRLKFEDIWTDAEAIQPWMSAVYSLVMPKSYTEGFGDNYTGIVDWKEGVFVFPAFRECFSYQQALRYDLRPYDRTFIDGMLPTYSAALSSHEPTAIVARDCCAE